MSSAGTLAQIKSLRDRDGDWCHYCGYEIRLWNPALSDKAAVSRDHIHAKALGGRDGLDNLALAHRYCNQVRGLGGGVKGMETLHAQFLQSLRDRGYARNYKGPEPLKTVGPDHFSISFAVRGLVVELKWIQRTTWQFRLSPKQSGAL